MEHYDIFISYKRKSLPTANNLYYRLTTRGYSTFFDLEEMRRDNFNIQLLNYIENAKDVFVILEEGSLDGCKKENWEKEDWFCYEIAFALEKKKNIIPILLGDYKMPSVDFFPDKLKELSLKHSPDFSFSFFDAYLDKLIKKKFITSEAHAQNTATSVFKFYSNENCQVFKEGKLVCSLEGMSDEPYYLPVPRKGDYRFKTSNDLTRKPMIIDEKIDENEEKTIEITWKHGLKTKDILKKSLKRYGKIIFVVILVSILMLLSWLIKIQVDKKPSAEALYSANLDTTQSMYEEIKDMICIPIDLGLPSGTLWGDKNVGAKTKYDYGCLYAWGETLEKREYTEMNYGVKSMAFSSIESTKLDVAYVSLGDEWCIPSEQQFKEMMDLCTWVWTENDTMNGYRVIGPNNNELFFPANGCADGYLGKANEYGYYWTCEISKKHANEPRSGLAKEIWFNKSKREIGEGLRYRGQGIRAVKRKL